MSSQRIVILCPQPRGHDGIFDHAQNLTSELRARGDHAVLALARIWRGTADGCSAPVAPHIRAQRMFSGPALARPDVLVVQFYAYGWARHGVTVRLLWILLTVRLRGRTRVLLFVHEPPAPRNGSFRRGVAAALQALQLRLLCRLSDRVATTASERYVDAVRRRSGHRAVGGLRLPSSFAFVERERHDPLLIGYFETMHDSRPDWFDACRATELPVKVDWVHLGGPPGADRDGVLRRRDIPEAEMSEWLARISVLLLPLRRGVSSRRTVLSAGLQAGCAVLSTHGVDTDEDLRDSHALVLVPDGDRDRFVQELAALVADPGRRESVGQEAMRLYSAEFGWDPIIELVRTIGT